MREDEDHFRQYMPVLRRLIILVAVLTAIPVVMWTITAFVRTYVGPPRVPTFRAIAAAPAAGGPGEALAAPAADAGGAATAASAAIGETANGAQQPVLETNATANAASGGIAAANPAPQGNPNAAPPAAPGTFRTASLPAANAPANAAPNPASGVAQFAPEDRQPPAANWPAPPPAANWASPPAQQPVMAAAPDGQPLGGNVPLPRKRPHTFTVVAQAHGIPLPRPRPDAAGPGAAGEDQRPTPIDFLRNLFGPHGEQPAAAAPPPAPDEYQPEPH
jgi:hypothetical protein